MFFNWLQNTNIYNRVVPDATVINIGRVSVILWWYWAFVKKDHPLYDTISHEWRFCYRLWPHKKNFGFAQFGNVEVRIKLGET